MQSFRNLRQLLKKKKPCPPKTCILKNVVQNNVEYKDELIRTLQQKNEYLVKKNTLLDKENNRFKLAFKQSLFEKEQLRKEVSAQSETVNDVIKQNTTLNEEMKVKDELIKALSEGTKDDNRKEKSNEPFPMDAKENGDDIQEIEMPDIMQKCKECDFKTRVKKYMISHKMSHDGKYQCQQGCRDKFKTLRLLDDHHQTHGAKAAEVDYKCKICAAEFASLHHLRQHVKSKHEEPNANNRNCKVTCQYCGLIMNSRQEMENHQRECNTAFQNVRNKICKYFVKGACFKGSLCKFDHPHEKQYRAAPECRNGIQCRYLLSGACSFFHRGVGVQRPRYNQEHDQENMQTEQTRKWCRYLEDCNRVPNCDFSHYEEDFPKLNKMTNPPIGGINKGWKGWQDY